MNRRSFIGKALAGIAAIPLLGKLVNSQQSDYFQFTSSGYFAGSKGLELIQPSRDFSVESWQKPCPLNFANRYRDHEVFDVPGWQVRDKILAEVKENGQVRLTIEDLERAFRDWEYEAIDAYCEKHGISLFVLTDETFVIRRVMAGGLGGAYTEPWPVSSASS